MSGDLWGGAKPEKETSLKDRSWKSKDNLVRGFGGGSEHVISA